MALGRISGMHDPNTSIPICFGPLWIQIKSVPTQRFLLIISTDTGGFYISETITAERPVKNSSQTYVAISKRIPNGDRFKDYTKGTKYETLEDAYAAYSEFVKDKYSKYAETLPK